MVVARLERDVVPDDLEAGLPDVSQVKEGSQSPPQGAMQSALRAVSAISTHVRSGA